MNKLGLSERIKAIYDAALSQDRWASALDALRNGTDTAGLMFYATNESQPISYSSHGISTSYSWVADHLPDYNDLSANPEIGTGLDAEGAAFMHNQDLFDPKMDTELWRRDEAFLSRPEIVFTRNRMGIDRRFFVNLSDDPLTFSAVIAHYSMGVDNPPFEKDMTLVAELAPHFSKALEMNRATASLRAKYNAVLSVLNMVNVPICVVLEDGHVLIHNRRAADLFQEKDGLWLAKDGKFSGRHKDDIGLLTHAISSMSFTAKGENTERARQIEIRRPSSTLPLYAVVSPLRDADMEIEPGLSGALVTLIDGLGSREMNVDLVARAYGISAAEARVIPFLLDGYSNVEAAEALNISPETVKSQVSSILSKTRCKNRVMFLWRIFQWSPPIL